MEIKKNWIPVEFEGNRLKLYKVAHSGKDLTEARVDQLRFHYGGQEQILPFQRTSDTYGLLDTSLEPSKAPELTKLFLRKLVEAELGIGGEKLLADYTIGPKEEGSPLFNLSFLGPDKAGQFFIMVSVDGLEDNISSYRLHQDITAYLAAADFSNHCGTSFTIQSDSPNPPSQDAYGPIPLPELHFRPDGLCKNTEKWTGLKNNEPFTADLTRLKSFRILTISSASKGTSMRQYLGELKDGLETVHKEGTYVWRKGWAEQFAFKGWENDELLLEHSDPDTNRRVLEDHLKNQANEYNLAILFTSENDLPNDPYLSIKTALLSHKIPFEVAELKRAETESDRAYRIRNTALRGYCKLGGIPWLLPQKKTMAQEIVIGVGCSSLSQGVYGFSLLFTRDGKFRLGEGSSYPSKETWSQDLGQYLVRQIDQLSKADQWKQAGQGEQGERIELVFHLDDSIEWSMKSGIKEQLTREFGTRFDLSMNFLRVGYQHCLRVWDLSRGHGRFKKETYRIQPGMVIPVDNDKMLLQLAYANQMHPLLIEKDADDPTIDLEAMVDQVFRFAHISSRDFNKGTLPVTLEYGHLITTQLDQFYKAGLGEEVSQALNQLNLNTWFL